MDKNEGPKNRKQNHNVSGKARAKRQLKREQAEARKAARDAKTTAQQIAELDMMFGEGKGAVKERARLANPKPKAETKEQQ
jgi:hypothetical protein